MFWYAINVFIIFILILLYFVIKKSDKKWSKVNDYLGMVTNTVNSVRYGNLSTKIEELNHPGYQNLSESIPEPVKSSLIHAKLPPEAISFSVTRINSKNKSNRNTAWQENIPMNPASTMKLVTTLGALDILGSQYRWNTNVYTNGSVNQGVLQGNLYWQGSGDPKLIPEESI